VKVRFETTKQLEKGQQTPGQRRRERSRAAETASSRDIFVTGAADARSKKAPAA
jgi:hypothetical protein